MHEQKAHGLQLIGVANKTHASITETNPTAELQIGCGMLLHACVNSALYTYVVPASFTTPHTCARGKFCLSVSAQKSSDLEI